MIENQQSKTNRLLLGPVRFRRFFSRLGPGLITGASDDDPSGIATYSQAGAAFGFGLAWTLVLSYPLMVGIQEIMAEARGLADPATHPRAMKRGGTARRNTVSDERSE